MDLEAVLEVYAGGRKFIREIDGGSSHASQNTSIAHFGLANYAIADSVSVIWLGGAKQTVKHIRANSFLKIIEGGNTQLLTEFHSAICADDSFYAGGAYQTTQGIYRDTNSVALNIDSIAITHLTVNPIPHTLHYNEICQGDSFLYNGISYYNDTTRQDTSVSSQGCDSIVIFTLHLTPISCDLRKSENLRRRQFLCKRKLASNFRHVLRYNSRCTLQQDYSH